MRRSSSVCHHSVRTSRSSSSSTRRREWPDARVVEAVQQRRDVPLVIEHRAPRGLGGVRRQHVLDLQLRGQRGDVDVVAAQDLGRLGQRLALDRAGRVVLAPAAHALALLGDVRQLELERAGADDRLDRLVGHAAEVGDEPLGGGLVARAHRRGGLEQPLQPGGEHAARLLLEHLDQRGREELGVVGEAIGRRGRRRGWERRDASWRGEDGLEGAPPARNPMRPGRPRNRPSTNS